MVEGEKVYVEKVFFRPVLPVAASVLCSLKLFAQDSTSPKQQIRSLFSTDCKSGYISKFKRKNVVRVFYGAGDFGMNWGSTGNNGTHTENLLRMAPTLLAVGLG
jgi:hypothetical protein